MRIELSGYQFFFPQLCACCGAPAQTSLVSSATNTIGTGRKQYTVTRAWNIPYCYSCVRHIRFTEAAPWVLLGLLGVFTFASLAAFLRTVSLTLGLQILALGGSLGVIGWLILISKARATRIVGCTGTGKAITYVGWQGSRHSFEMRSWSYAHAFMRMNERKLINLSPHTVRHLRGSGLDQEKAPQAAKRYLPRMRK